MRRWILALAAASMLIAVGSVQRADARVHARIGVGYYGGWYRPAPVYVVPQPVYVRRYYAPYPVYYDDGPYYRPVVYGEYPGDYYDDDDWGPAWSVGLSFGGHGHHRYVRGGGGRGHASSHRWHR